MTLRELRDSIAAHYHKLHLVKVGGNYIVMALGIIIEIKPSTISLYIVEDKELDSFFADLLLTELPDDEEGNQQIPRYTVRSLIEKSKLAHNFELANPGSIDAIDTLISARVQFLIDHKREKWVLAK